MSVLLDDAVALFAAEFDAYWPHINNKKLTEEVEASAKRQLEVGEICDGLLQRYYRLEKVTASLLKQTQDALFTRWIIQLGKVTGPTWKQGLEEALRELPDIL